MKIPLSKTIINLILKQVALNLIILVVCSLPSLSQVERELYFSIHFQEGFDVDTISMKINNCETFDNTIISSFVYNKFGLKEDLGRAPITIYAYRVKDRPFLDIILFTIKDKKLTSKFMSCIYIEHEDMLVEEISLNLKVNNRENSPYLLWHIGKYLGIRKIIDDSVITSRSEVPFNYY